MTNEQIANILDNEPNYQKRAEKAFSRNDRIELLSNQIIEELNNLQIEKEHQEINIFRAGYREGYRAALKNSTSNKRNKRGNVYMFKTIMAVFMCLLLGGIPSAAHAFFGGGISGPLPVYNTNASVDAATLATQINTAQQLTNQYQQLQNELANLASMDPAAAAANIGGIQNALTSLMALQEQMSGFAMDYQTFQNQWDDTYKDFSDYNGMSGNDYANHAAQMMQLTKNQTYDAMRAQGLVSQIGANTNNLQGLLNASQSAQGALAAAQAGNQIAAMQAQQMMALQQMVGQSNQAQLAYQQQKIQQEAASEMAASKAYSDDVTPTKRGTGMIR